MNLQEIFYGTFVPPENVRTRSFRIGFASSFRYKEPSVRPKREYKTGDGGLNLSEKKVYAAIKSANSRISAVDLAPKVKMTKNHCGVILAALFKRGLLTRYKVKSGNTRMYVYSINKEQGNENV